MMLLISVDVFLIERCWFCVSSS